MENNIFTELKRFREDRSLDKHKFDMETYLRKDYEEGFELQGYENKYCKQMALQRAAAEVEFRLDPVTTNGTKVKVTDNSFVKVDALCDRIVFAIEAIEQLGYDAEIAMLEVAKEINSREGEIVNGKFEKYKTPEAMAKWYKADFHKAKRDYSEKEAESF